MPIDYKNYPANWKTEIRPYILERAKHCCEKCYVPNYMVILRGVRNGREVYQDDNGTIYCAETSLRVGDDYVGEVCENPNKQAIKVVLTIAHLDHDIKNNEYINLMALCQRCHNRHDKDQRKANRKKNRGAIELFN